MSQKRVVLGTPAVVEVLCCCCRDRKSPGRDRNSGATCVTWKSRCLVALVCVSLQRTTVNTIHPTLQRPASEVPSAQRIHHSVRFRTDLACILCRACQSRGDSPYVSLLQRSPFLFSLLHSFQRRFPPGACSSFLGPACFWYRCVPGGFSRVPYAEPIYTIYMSPGFGWARGRGVSQNHCPRERGCC